MESTDVARGEEFIPSFSLSAAKTSSDEDDLHTSLAPHQESQDAPHQRLYMIIHGALPSSSRNASSSDGPDDATGGGNSTEPMSRASADEEEEEEDGIEHSDAEDAEEEENVEEENVEEENVEEEEEDDRQVPLPEVVEVETVPRRCRIPSHLRPSAQRHNDRRRQQHKRHQCRCR